MKQITIFVTSCADCPLVKVEDSKHYCTAVGGKGYCLVDFGIDIDPSCPFPTVDSGTECGPPRDLRRENE